MIQEIEFAPDSPLARWREVDSNHRSLSYNQYPKEARELSAQGQPRCVRTREMLERSRYPDDPWFDGDQRHARTLYRNPTRRE